MERITGPLKGYYIAVYANRLVEAQGQYVGFVKLCRREPPSYWEADCLVKDCAEGTWPSIEEALQHAEDLARQEIACLPPLIRLPPE
jgi:hypothetical protein